MKQRLLFSLRTLSLMCSLLFSVDTTQMKAGPTTKAIANFDTYISTVESRLAQQHRSTNAFLAPAATEAGAEELRLRNGAFIIEQISEPLISPNDPSSSGALLHHWRGTAFARGATAKDFETLMRDFNSYPKHFAPQVLEAKVLSQNGDHLHTFMRVRQKHVITVVMDSDYDVDFNRVDFRRGYSISRSTQIFEIDNPGTNRERTVDLKDEHGFLWRLNTYWSYEQREEGLYLQVEVISLTRSIPLALGWTVRPYLESIPRESMEFTLRSICNALRGTSPQTDNSERGRK